jgi:HD-like signal output (HDOD) protein
MPADDFARLELLCRRVSTLPVLPTSALQLIRTIDTGEASAAELEKIIVNDPSLSAEFLRLATTTQIGKQGPQLSSIRAGIMRMGQRTVRALATSLLLRDLSRGDGSPAMDMKQFAKHSLAVGLLAKFLFARRKMQGEFTTRWTADEVFAAGLLNDLGFVLLSRMLPETYTRLSGFAKKSGSSLDNTFLAAFERPASALGAAAADTWGLPDIFTVSLNYVHAPWEFSDEYTVLCCLNFANALARDFGLGMETWETPVQVSPQVMFEMNLAEEEQANLREVLCGQIEAYSEGLAESNAVA